MILGSNSASAAREIPFVVPVPEVLPVNENSEPLTNCVACRRQIAKKAEICPKCGAPNEWMHSEIARFYGSISEFKFPPGFQFSHRKYVLFGADEEAGKGERSISDFVNGFGLIGDVSTVVAFVGVKNLLRDWAAKKIKAFRIDFASSPPIWNSTDDTYWADVMEFFGVPMVSPQGIQKKKQRRLLADE